MRPTLGWALFQQLDLKQQHVAHVQGTAQAFLELAQKHYPERLQKLLIVNAPKVFSVIWNTVLPIMDPTTRQKIVFVPCDL
jgi:hypothetical protein